jgi:hypothetical protein
MIYEFKKRRSLFNGRLFYFIPKVNWISKFYDFKGHIFKTLKSIIFAIQFLFTIILLTIFANEIRVKEINKTSVSQNYTSLKFLLFYPDLQAGQNEF